VELTDAGRARLCELERRLQDAEAHLLAPLDRAEQDTLRALLERLATADPDQASPCQVAQELSDSDCAPAAASAPTPD
jgi:hypothetical protein